MPYPSPRLAFAFAGEPVLPALSGAHQRAVELIARYPHLSKAELERLAYLVPRLSALDMSLLMADAELCPRLEAFCTTHRTLLGPSFADMAVIGAILSLPIAIFMAIVLSGV